MQATPGTCRTVAALDFLAEVSAHIPDAHEKTTLFYGWYSNPACAVHADRRTRGYRRQHGLLGTTPVVKPAPEASDQAPLEVRRTWARLIRQVYEVDPLLCPHCGGAMKVIALIHRPAVIQQILEHLGLSTAAPSLRAPPDPPDGLVADPPRAWSYEPLLDDLPASDPVMA